MCRLQTWGRWSSGIWFYTQVPVGCLGDSVSRSHKSQGIKSNADSISTRQRCWPNTTNKVKLKLYIFESEVLRNCFVGELKVTAIRMCDTKIALCSSFNFPWDSSIRRRKYGRSQFVNSNETTRHSGLYFVSHTQTNCSTAEVQPFSCLVVSGILFLWW